MSVARAALVGSALAAAFALSGCNSEQKMATNTRSVQPLSPELVSLMTEKGVTPQDPMLVRLFKEEAKAEVWKKRRADGRYTLLKSYDICRFSGKLGPKIKEGDKQAPEGFYSVTPGQMNPNSSYYLSFNIGYPNAYDRSLGRNGTHVMMHGDCLSAGCYAMTDAQIGEIYAMARESFRGGQKAFQIQALPFHMTAQNMARRRNDKNMAFWKNLKQGSDHFEVTKMEPKVDVCGKKYVFNARPGAASAFTPEAACPSYQVEPTIAKAVTAKEKADNILIAQLSKTEPVAPDYVAQNGRLRRTLDQPIVMVAAVAPEAAGAPVAAAPAPGGGVALASVVPPSPKAAGPAQVALRTTVGAEDASARKPEGNLFARMFRSEEPESVASIPAPAAGSTQVAAAKSASVPGRREVAANQQPVMATAVSPAPEEPSTGARLKNWVGGLFGGQKAEPAPVVVPVSEPAPVEAPAPAARKNRSASLPPQLQPRASGRPDPRITSSFAAFD